MTSRPASTDEQPTTGSVPELSVAEVLNRVADELARCEFALHDFQSEVSSLLPHIEGQAAMEKMQNLDHAGQKIASLSRAMKALSQTVSAEQKVAGAFLDREGILREMRDRLSDAVTTDPDVAQDAIGQPLWF